MLRLAVPPQRVSMTLSTLTDQVVRYGVTCGMMRQLRRVGATHLSNPPVAPALGFIVVVRPRYTLAGELVAVHFLQRS